VRSRHSALGSCQAARHFRVSSDWHGHCLRRCGCQWCRCRRIGCQARAVPGGRCRRRRRGRKTSARRDGSAKAGPIVRPRVCAQWVSCGTKSTARPSASRRHSARPSDRGSTGSSGQAQAVRTICARRTAIGIASWFTLPRSLDRASSMLRSLQYNCLSIGILERTIGCSMEPLEVDWNGIHSMPAGRQTVRTGDA
jgi:hypothetical protein